MSDLNYILYICCIALLSSCESVGITCCGDLDAPYPIEVVGSNYEWQFRYPGSDCQLHTKDDIIAKQDLHLPANSSVRLHLHSTDYLYFFELPEFQIIATAVPDMRHSIDLSTAQSGVFRIRGDQMCGYIHESLHGQLKVKSKRLFIHWLSKQ